MDKTAANKTESPPVNGEREERKITDLSDLSQEEYETYMQTGNLPGAPKKEASATSKKQTSDTDDESEEKSAPASEAGKPDKQETTGKAEARNAELQKTLDEFRELGLKPSEVKEYLASKKGETSKPETTVNPPLQTKTDLKPPEKPTRPRYSDYDSDDEYEEAMDKYETDKEKYDDFMFQYRAQKQEQERAEKELAQTLKKEVGRAGERYGKDASAAIAKSMQTVLTTPGVDANVIKAIDESPVMIDLLYTIGHDEEVFNEFIEAAKGHPTHALRLLTRFEDEIVKTLSGSNGGSEDESDEEPPETIPKTPPPPDEVGGTKGPLPDKVKNAVASGNVSAYIEEMNRKEAEILQGKR